MKYTITNMSRTQRIRLRDRHGRYYQLAPGDTITADLVVVNTPQLLRWCRAGTISMTKSSVSVALGQLTLTPSTARVGTAYSGTISGRATGSTLTLSGAGAAGLSVNSTSGAVSGTPTAEGVIDITETLSSSPPRKTSGAGNTAGTV